MSRATKSGPLSNRMYIGATLAENDIVVSVGSKGHSYDALPKRRPLRAGTPAVGR